MAITRSVQTCRWGTPTLFLQWPLWYEASQHEWSCTRGAARVLADPAICGTCPYWVHADCHVKPAPPERAADHCRYRGALVRRDDGEEAIPVS